MGKEIETKMITPCDVAITRYYRMYVTTDKDAGADEVAVSARRALLEAEDPDALLTPDPDMDIENSDITSIFPDTDGCWWDGGEPGEAAPKDCKRNVEMGRVARNAAKLIGLARPERVIRIEYIKPDAESIQQFTSWQIKYLAIREDDEYFLVWDDAPNWNTNKPDLLYAVNVSIDSILCAAWELFGVLRDKF